ncbi:MAG: hypothetical protein K8W52_05850 [Deltaproteobacteria bacterium]|nr:hypothetical protein [Deltaproteobacteria bacterium]
MRRFGGLASFVFLSVGLAAGLCVGACGGGQSFPDASSIDAVSFDGNTTPDATPSGDITVTTHSRVGGGPSGTLVADVPVFTVQPDGTAGPSGTTSASGDLTLTGVKAGASVTAVYPVNGGYQLVTVLAVKPGDHVVLGDHYLAPLGTSTGTMTVTFPTVPNAAYYYGYNRCSSASVNDGAATSMTFATTCGNATADMSFEAYDGKFARLGYASLHGAPYTDGATAAITAWTPATSGDNFALSITGLGAAVDVVYFSTFAQWTDGFRRAQQDYYAQPAAGEAALMMTVPTGSDHVLAYAQLHQQTLQTGSQETYRVLAPSATSVAMTAPTLPWLGQVTINGAAQIAQWIPIGTGSYDAAVVFANWQRFDPSNESTTYYYWTISVPPGQTSLSWAGLPTAIADQLPTAADAVVGDMQLVDLSDAADYDALRARPEWEWSCPGCASQQGDRTEPSSVAFPFDGAEGFNPSFAAGHASGPHRSRLLRH